MTNTKRNKPSVDLAGKDGNAFAIVGRCVSVARKNGWSTDQVAEFREKALADDYDNLLRVCMEYFDVR